MLQIIQRFGGVSANNTAAGDLNAFLTEVLVEAIAENYRQTLYEAITLTEPDKDEYNLDPPLRANERVMSGLFATAISRSALRSQSEVRIDRLERDLNAAALGQDLEIDEPTTVKKNGRVDYLAWYGSRVIGIELKMAGMNCENQQLTQAIAKRWASTVDQAKTAQTCLRARQKEDGFRYPNPISIALMVIVGRRNINRLAVDDVNEEVECMRDTSLAKIAGLKPAPTFQAVYTFPEELRALTLRQKGKATSNAERVMFTPFVMFIAKPSVNAGF